MSNELAKKPIQALDGFDGYEDGIEGDDRPQSGGIIQGSLLKFTIDYQWVTREGEVLSPSPELIVVDIARVVQKWIDQKPVDSETRILAPGEKFPDIDALNDAAPRSEWAEGPSGKPQGPWQGQQIVYLLNLTTMDKYTFPTGTTGGKMAVRELVDKTSWMRRYRGDHVYPIVTLTDTFMKTRFGGRQRPHFHIVRWETYGDEGAEALPAPSAPVLPPPADAQAQGDAQTPPAASAPEAAPPAPKWQGPPTATPAPATKTGKRGKAAKEVKPPSISEELDDEIGF